MAGKKLDISTREMTEKMVRAAEKFFKEHGSPKLLGRSLAKIFTGVRPGERFDVFMATCGYEQDPKTFFAAVFDSIPREFSPGDQRGVVLNGIFVPVLFLYCLLELLQPLNRLTSVKTIDQLKEKTGLCLDDHTREAVQQVMDEYPVRLSDHVIRQSQVSDAVAIQYLPFAEELDPRGHTITFDGHFKKGLLEQMYQNRVIFLLDMRCPVYCRFCFRKHKSFRREKNPSVADVKRAVEQVKNQPLVKEILITGGEPLLNRKNMEAALDGLMEIDHVKSLRIATRSIAYYPHLFLKNNREYLGYLKSKQADCVKIGKRIEIGVHFVHPDEVSLASLDIISDLVKAGIVVYVQTPFLNKLNNSGPVLARLFTLLRNAGAQIYYIFTPCHPIHGTQIYWTPISQSIEAHHYLRAHLSDRCIPKLCTATPLGKMEWHTSGWAVKIDESDPDHIWIRTPYTREYFSCVTGEDTPLHDSVENEDKTLNVKCLIDMGDKDLFLGDHCLAGQVSGATGHRAVDRWAVYRQVDQDLLQKIKEDLFSCRFSIPGIIKTPSPVIARVHKTRVELDLTPDNGLGNEPGTAAMDYIRKNLDITDVILHVPTVGESTIISQLDRICQLIDSLGGMDHIACIRIRWQAFQTNPKGFTPEIIDQIARLARFSIGDPLKIEIETWWLLPRDLLSEHGTLAGQLACQGIQTYANLALISGINDDPAVVCEMAQGFREAGMDFHHCYVAGLCVQNRFNGAHPIETDQVLAIASHVRKVCSGREIPLYMIQTPLGEVDFGLTSKLVRGVLEKTEEKECWFLQLAPYDVPYFKAFAPDFDLAKTGARKVDGNLLVPMAGLVRSGNFPL
jgi:L-lysine 2,3-aminomutase